MHSLTRVSVRGEASGGDLLCSRLQERRNKSYTLEQFSTPEIEQGTDLIEGDTNEEVVFNCTKQRGWHV